MKVGKGRVELNKLSKEELISEYKNLVRRIRELNKEKKQINPKCRDYYREKDYYRAKENKK